MRQDVEKACFFVGGRRSCDSVEKTFPLYLFHIRRKVVRTYVWPYGYKFGTEPFLPLLPVCGAPLHSEFGFSSTWIRQMTDQQVPILCYPDPIPSSGAAKAVTTADVRSPHKTDIIRPKAP
jgi:hypothetical protein